MLINELIIKSPELISGHYCLSNVLDGSVCFIALNYFFMSYRSSDTAIAVGGTERLLKAPFNQWKIIVGNETPFTTFGHFMENSHQVNRGSESLKVVESLCT